MRTTILTTAIAMAALLAGALHAQVTTAFTYQGELEEQGSPASGQYDFRFLLYQAESGGTAFAGPVSVDDVLVNDGLFTAEVDFGFNAWGITDQFLEIRVREGDSSGGYTILAPRQQITPAPLAQHALNVENDAIGADQISSNAVGGSELSSASVGSSQLADDSVDQRHLRSDSVTGQAIADNSVSGQNVVDLSLGGNELADFSISAQKLASDSIESRHITDGSVSGPQIADHSIDGQELAKKFEVIGNTSTYVATFHNTQTTTGGGLNVIGEATSTTAPALLSSAWRGSPAIWGQSFGLGSSDRVLVLQNNTWSGTPGASGYTPNTILEVEGNGDLNIDGSLSASGADFAESISVNGKSEPGDVMMIDAADVRSVKVADQSASSLVAGIHSTKPGVIGRTAQHNLDQEGYIAMAVVGIVPCKVSTENGSIETGDLLVTSGTDGHAMRSESPNPGTIVGKALAAFDGQRGTIPVLIALQ